MNQFGEANQLETITRGFLVVILATVLSVVAGAIVALSFNAVSLVWNLGLSVLIGTSIGIIAATQGRVRKLAWKLFDNIFWYLPL